jgi:hypothetical protein
LCNMACFLMILYRNEKILFEQEELAGYFWVKIHPQYKDSFDLKLEYTTEINDDEWLKTIESSKKIKDFLKEKKIGLTVKAFKYSIIENLKLFIEKNLIDWNDLWIEYKTQWIFEWSKWIHDWLIESIDWNIITIIDPTPENKNRYKVHIDYIKEALSDKFARETWIILIKKK